MLLVGLVAVGTVLVAGPASAKVDLVRAEITGPGLAGGLRIKASETYGLWDSGIDMDVPLDDSRVDSVEGLGLTSADLGPKYVVVYRFGIGRARQDLYPYAKGGPVTYTPPGQELGRGRDLPDFLRNMPVIAGWYRSPPIFFRYLVEHGLPATNPAPPADTREPGPDTAPRASTVPLGGIVVVLVGLGALSTTALVARRSSISR